MLHAAEAPDHHDLHPQPKIQAQKLMENAAVGMAASAKMRPARSRDASMDMGAIINRRNRFPPAGV
jgi:hypothetical protein